MALIISPYREQIFHAANAAGLDPWLVEAIVWQESRSHADAFRYEPKFWLRYMAKSPQYKQLSPPRRYSSSYGLMQIMWVVAKELGYLAEPEGLFIPSTNLVWGCRKLKQLTAWGNGYPGVPLEDRKLAVLASYNGGTGGNTPGTPLRPDNYQYAQRVLATQAELLLA